MSEEKRQRIEQQYREILQIFAPNGPDRDRVQYLLTAMFISELQSHPDLTPDQITETFGKQYEEQLSWLGEDRQDAMIKDAMQQTSIDLSHWLGKESK